MDEFPTKVKVAYTSVKHWDGLRHLFESKVNNRIQEEESSLLQLTKLRVLHYLTNKNYIYKAFLILDNKNFRSFLKASRDFILDVFY